MPNSFYQTWNLIIFRIWSEEENKLDVNKLKSLTNWIGKGKLSNVWFKDGCDIQWPTHVNTHRGKVKKPSSIYIYIWMNILDSTCAMYIVNLRRYWHRKPLAFTMLDLDLYHYWLEVERGEKAIGAYWLGNFYSWLGYERWG